MHSSLPLAAAALMLVAAPAAVLADRPVAAKAQARAINPALAAAVADPRRNPDRARDTFRKPAETLSFFQVGPTMKVGE